MTSPKNKTGSLEITGTAKPTVPTIPCVVHIKAIESEGDACSLVGRVVNLDGIEATGNSERDILQKLTREFKAIVVELSEAGQSIPWVEVPELEKGERKRSIPVHL
ncbi:MAG: hypothetical protein AAGA30_15215 [Planctomycetota bacterium]